MVEVHSEALTRTPTIGVIIVTYRSADVIRECLASLRSSSYPCLKIIVCDNASTDDTVDHIRSWAAECNADYAEYPAEVSQGLDFSKLANFTLLLSSKNLGFAGGVNIGLRALMRHQEVEFFWLLNPDSVVQADTAAAYSRAAQSAGCFALMGGRIIYLESPHPIQSDGGRVNRWTGICSNINSGRMQTEVALPEVSSIDFISGASVLVSRPFIERAGLLSEDYFLYYEEVDWAFRRGDLPIIVCPEALVHHHGGTSIGSATVNRRGSDFAAYFNYRNRIRFVLRHNWPALPVAYFYSLLKVIKLAFLGGWREAASAARGLHQLPPPAAVRARLSPEAALLAFQAKLLG